MFKILSISLTNLQHMSFLIFRSIFMIFTEYSGHLHKRISWKLTPLVSGAVALKIPGRDLTPPASDVQGGLVVVMVSLFIGPSFSLPNSFS